MTTQGDVTPRLMIQTKHFFYHTFFLSHPHTHMHIHTTDTHTSKQYVTFHKRYDLTFHKRYDRYMHRIEHPLISLYSILTLLLLHHHHRHAPPHFETVIQTPNITHRTC